MNKEERKKIMFEMRDAGRTWFYIGREFGVGKTLMETVSLEYDNRRSPFIFLKDVTKKTLAKLSSTERVFLGVITRRNNRLNLYTKCVYCLENEFVGYDMYNRNSIHKPCRKLLDTHSKYIKKTNDYYGQELYTNLIGN